MAPVKVRLYTIPGSHPGMAAQLMLAHKGISYRRKDLFPVLSKLIVRAAGFPRKTVPAVTIDGEKVQGSREIARELDRLRPDPPLFPADPEKRAAVEEAERFGDEELQHPIRQIIWWSFRRDKSPLTSYSEGAKLGVPIPLAVKTAAPIVALSARFNEATDENVRADLEALGGLLDRVDEMIAAGTLNGEQLNAADFQIAPSLKLAMTMQDLRPLIESRPAGELVRRVDPKIAGDFPPILPAEWLEPLRQSTPAS
jgi:glutathione S-transferase